MSFRHFAVVGVGVALVVSLAGCTSKAGGGSGALSGGASPSAAVSAPASPAPVVTVTATVTPTAPATPAYPADYFAAILGAWKAHDTAYLTLLTDATTASKFFGFGNINQTWTGTGANGAAGSTYQSFFNNAGDWLTLRLVNQETSAKHWHAGSINAWDQMTFPNDPVVYVRHFVDAWINGNTARMKLLSSAALTSEFTGMSSKPDLSYTATGDGAAGHTYVEVKETSAGFDVTLEVLNMNVGKHNAIESCFSGC